MTDIIRSHYINQLDESIIDTGNITSWFWDFDDGNISTEQHPVHDYSSATTYNVDMIPSVF